MLADEISLFGDEVPNRLEKASNQSTQLTQTYLPSRPLPSMPAVSLHYPSRADEILEAASERN
jgi:hypothetical protein